MKKLLTTSLAALAFATYSYAAENESMMFTLDDGTQQYISSKGLAITFSNGNLIAKNDAESLTLPLTEVKSMQFSNNAGVEDIFSDNDSSVKAYSLDGVFKGEFQNLEKAKQLLDNGVYVCKNSNGGSFKILVTK